jgi:hypothetical protein
MDVKILMRCYGAGNTVSVQGYLHIRKSLIINVHTIRHERRIATEEANTHGYTLKNIFISRLYH